MMSDKLGETLRRSRRRLIGMLAALVVTGVAPALPHVRFVGEPLWSQILLLGGALLLAYVIWMATLPHERCLSFLTWVFAAAGAAGALMLAVILFTPRTHALPLEITSDRNVAIGACAWIAATMSAASLLAGRQAAVWKRVTKQAGT